MARGQKVTDKKVAPKKLAASKAISKKKTTEDNKVLDSTQAADVKA